MKRIFAAYKDLIKILYKESPFVVVLTFICTFVNGLLTPLGIYLNQNVFDGGVKVASGEMKFSAYIIFLVLFVIVAILPEILVVIIFNYIQPRSILILRTAYRARMLKKLKTMKYEHFENEESAEIIDKAFNRTEQAVWHLWPMFVYWRMGALIASIGTLCYAFSIRWWLVLTILMPFILETFISTKNNYNIYAELETYWKQEKKYGILGEYLKSRNYMKELKAYGNVDYLIDIYKNRLSQRNRNYEHYYFRNLSKILLGSNITKFGIILNVIILLILFINRQMSAGLFIAITSLMFGNVYNNLDSFAGFFKWSGMHIKTYEYYDKFFSLSDDEVKVSSDLPDSFDIEFRNVWFRYPGTDKDILKGLTFKINSGEKTSIVGGNGEGKTTIVKLLLGLFSPDKGEILIGGKLLEEYPMSERAKIFGPVFQDFTKYSITVKENIGIGNMDKIENDTKIKEASIKGGADTFISKYKLGYDTLLGRDFEDGIDLSGGQWQRIALARAFMGDKPILLLDEPTSQLDPVAEANLYSEFANMVENKTTLFITHRLGSTMITDKILVIHNGKITETGTHEKLMNSQGIYADMFNAQKQWYKHQIKGAAVNEE